MTRASMMMMMTRATIALQVSPGSRLSLRQDGTRSDFDFVCIHDHDDDGGDDGDDGGNGDGDDDDGDGVIYRPLLA